MALATSAGICNPIFLPPRIDTPISKINLFGGALFTWHLILALAFIGVKKSDDFLRISSFCSESFNPIQPSPLTFILFALLDLLQVSWTITINHAGEPKNCIKRVFLKFSMKTVSAFSGHPSFNELQKSISFFYIHRVAKVEPDTLLF